MDDGKTPLHKRGLEWFTSHALWEIAKYVAFLASAGVLSVGVTRIFHAALDTGISIFLVLIGVIGILLAFGAVRWTASRKEKREEAKLEVFVFSPGLALSLMPSMGRVIVNLQFLATKATELVYVRITVRNNKGANLDCERSEPILFAPMLANFLTIDRKFLPQELTTFEKGEMVNLDGYAKFRDGNSIKQFQFSFTTIPSM